MEKARATANALAFFNPIRSLRRSYLENGAQTLESVLKKILNV